MAKQMKSRRPTEELIERLVREPLPRRLVPAFPIVPIVVGTVFGGAAVYAIGAHIPGLSQMTFESRQMVLIALSAIATGLWLCLMLAAPDAKIGHFSGAAPVALAGTVISSMPSDAAVSFAQFTECLVFTLIMALPTLAVSLFLLRRGATLHPIAQGAAAGLFSAGLAGLIFQLHCPDLLTGAGLHAEIAALILLAAAGGLLGQRTLAW